MNIRLLTLTLALCSVAPHLSAGVCPNIANCTFDFNSSEAFSGSNFGTVNLALATSQITITIDLADGFKLIKTGSHEAFSFNDTVGGVFTIGSFSDNRYVVDTNPPYTNSPFGEFERAITTAVGANDNGTNVLSFVVSRTGGFSDVNQLVAFSTQNAYFAADVFKSTGCTGGCTGVIGVTGSPASVVPEPSAYAVLLFGAGGAMVAIRRRVSR